ncbi:phosphatidate cytidylyltransferase [Streptomyces sp. NRRL F-5755]|uniref:phosphatidate cytidylyltransferase n=1 Tax=Streptomyces sp. NRRL F-5755 TaxID=1519475 RepID=UPI0006AED979|nr:phosphatidate cytidylyltransferase [Streptomyces sp. NRRL F-5755]
MNVTERDRAPRSQDTPSSTDTEGGTASSRGGRDLGRAVLVGILLAAAACGALITGPLAFAVLAAVGAVVAIAELGRRPRQSGLRVALLPVHLGTQLMVWTGWYFGDGALVRVTAAAVLICLAWHLAHGTAGYLRNAAASVLLLGYLALPTCCAVLLVRKPHGTLLVLAVIACVVATDTAGYATGSLLGRHPMAPAISPRKSWEGLAGSLSAATAVGIAALGRVVRAPWWQGALFGALIAVAAVAGDLVESAVKRDLGIKDMSTLLPGHGGLMDRLDSLLPAMVAAWAVLGPAR